MEVNMHIIEDLPNQDIEPPTEGGDQSENATSDAQEQKKKNRYDELDEWFKGDTHQ
jgi:hypothetical protein